MLVAATGQTSAVWERLQAAVVVAPSMQDDTAVGQYDISYQLAEIEVSRSIIIKIHVININQLMWAWPTVIRCVQCNSARFSPHVCMFDQKCASYSGDMLQKGLLVLQAPS